MNENVKKSRYISGRSRSITLFENIHECRYGEIMHIASIKAWGLCGKKIQRCDGSEIIIEEGIGNIIKECEVLILLEVGTMHRLNI